MYSLDTIKRLKEYAKLRKSRTSLVLHGDSRHIDIRREMNKNWRDKKLIGGIFTSPPYVGRIDYHEQHRYAYELFGIRRNDDSEIGTKKLGKGRIAIAKYRSEIVSVLVNMNKALRNDAKVFMVANDKFDIFPGIIEDSRLKLVKVWKRAVEGRNEGDQQQFVENIFKCSKSKK